MEGRLSWSLATCPTIPSLIAKLGSTVPHYNIRITTGVSFKRLLDIAEEEIPWMIVIGTKGRGNLAGVILGSTAEKLFRHCPFPLLSVRAISSPE